MSKKIQEVIDKNYEFYKENAESIYEKYKEQYIVISDSKIIASFNTMSEAYGFWVSKYWLWNFIAQSANYNWSVVYLSRLSFL